MLKVINAELSSLGQSFLDELDDVDWGDEPQRPSPSGRISPHGPQGIINERNFEQFEPTTIEEPIEEGAPTAPTVPDRPLDYRQEIPTQNELLGIPPDTNEIEYADSQQLVYDGIDNNEVVSFDYTNRHGQYAGTRTVEPHYTFIARTTGNEVLVTFDRDQNDIRAFIVGNIHPYGVRYEEVIFDPKGEIMRGIF
ncbi:MAG: WYL domain-containing protein [Promethearchaeota archaeon]|jgi:hypothetical protein